MPLIHHFDSDTEILHSRVLHIRLFGKAPDTDETGVLAMKYVRFPTQLSQRLGQADGLLSRLVQGGSLVREQLSLTKSFEFSVSPKKDPPRNSATAKV